jgi:hypothetical protein
LDGRVKPGHDGGIDGPFSSRLGIRKTISEERCLNLAGQEASSKFQASRECEIAAMHQVPCFYVARAKINIFAIRRDLTYWGLCGTATITSPTIKGI